MFSVGWSELFLVVVVALFVIGPKELPIVLKQLGRWSRQISRYISGLKSELHQVIEDEELKDFKDHMRLYDPGKEALGDYAKYYEWDEDGNMKIPNESNEFKPKAKAKTEDKTLNA